MVSPREGDEDGGRRHGGTRARPADSTGEHEDDRDTKIQPGRSLPPAHRMDKYDKEEHTAGRLLGRDAGPGIENSRANCPSCPDFSCIFVALSAQTPVSQVRGLNVEWPTVANYQRRG